MMNPVSASLASAQAGYGAQQATSKQPQPPQKQASWPQDKVTIKGSESGGGDHDGDSK
jgi:hypothetical protein